MERAPPSMPRLELVVAVAEDGCIGRDGALPWRLPDDLRRFKALTLGKPVVMGRKTYESIGKALPGRRNIVLSRSNGFAPPDAAVAADLAAALGHAAPADVVMVIGGAQVYAQALPLATVIHLTLVHARVAGGDTFFDGWRAAEWVTTEIERRSADDRHAHAFDFLTLRRDPARAAAAVARS